MIKSAYKKLNNKNKSIQDRLYHKGFFYISNSWIKWAKNYLNRSQRRKNKQDIKNITKNYRF